VYCSLIAQQKANLKSSSSGKALLSRLAKSNPSASSSTKTKAKTARVVIGADKVGRAKAKGNKDAMDIDQDRTPGVGVQQGKKKAKSQEELDEEMRLYERSRRFAAA
jgi:hypothetical protein